MVFFQVHKKNKQSYKIHLNLFLFKHTNQIYMLRISHYYFYFKSVIKQPKIKKKKERKTLSAFDYY